MFLAQYVGPSKWNSIEEKKGKENVEIVFERIIQSRKQLKNKLSLTEIDR